jgi:hypothetical protein
MSTDAPKLWPIPTNVSGLLYFSFNEFITSNVSKALILLSLYKYANSNLYDA